MIKVALVRLREAGQLMTYQVSDDVVVHDCSSSGWICNRVVLRSCLAVPSTGEMRM